VNILVKVTGKRVNRHWLLTASIGGMEVATSGGEDLARAFGHLFNAVGPTEVTLDSALINALIVDGK
jgi:hypothetical protein